MNEKATAKMTIEAANWACMNGITKMEKDLSAKPDQRSKEAAVWVGRLKTQMQEFKSHYVEWVQETQIPRAKHERCALQAFELIASQGDLYSKTISEPEAQTKKFISDLEDLGKTKLNELNQEKGLKRKEFETSEALIGITIGLEIKKAQQSLNEQKQKPLEFLISEYSYLAVALESIQFAMTNNSPLYLDQARMARSYVVYQQLLYEICDLSNKHDNGIVASHLSLLIGEMQKFGYSYSNWVEKSSIEIGSYNAPMKVYKSLLPKAPDLLSAAKASGDSNGEKLYEGLNMFSAAGQILFKLRMSLEDNDLKGFNQAQAALGKHLGKAPNVQATYKPAEIDSSEIGYAEQLGPDESLADEELDGSSFVTADDGSSESSVEEDRGWFSFL